MILKYLDNLPNNATAFFHCLTKDIRFLECYGIRNTGCFKSFRTRETEKYSKQNKY